MKKESFFEKLRNKNDEKYIKEHGREKFLLEQSKAYDIMILMTVASLATGAASLYMGVWLLNIFYAAGIMLFVGSGLMLFSSILLASQLPRIKRKSKAAKEELLTLLKLTQETNKNDTEQAESEQTKNENPENGQTENEKSENE